MHNSIFTLTDKKEIYMAAKFFTRDIGVIKVQNFTRLFFTYKNTLYDTIF